MQQAKGKAETVTYIFWDSPYACNESEHLLVPRSKGSGAKCPTSIPSSGRLSKGDREALATSSSLTGRKKQKTHKDSPTR